MGLIFIPQSASVDLMITTNQLTESLIVVTSAISIPALNVLNTSSMLTKWLRRLPRDGQVTLNKMVRKQQWNFNLFL